MFAALCCVILIGGSFAETLSLSVAALASVPILILLAEYGSVSAFACYAAASILSVILALSKSAPLEFACFFGLYPIIKRLAEKKRKPLRVIIKTFTLIACCAVYLFSSLLLVGDNTEIPEKLYYILLPLLTAVAFVLYDRCLTLFMRIYAVRIRPRISKYL